MKRLRLRFTLLSLVVLVPVAFLVYRAVRSAELETRMQHQAIAERIFDEMERGLSQLLENEERRPVETFMTATEPSLPFVIGHFEIEPGGRVEIAAAAPGVNDALQPQPDRKAKSKDDADLEAKLSSYWTGDTSAKEEARSAPAQVPGTTMAFSDRSRGNMAAERSGANPPAVGDEVSTLQVLRSLNKGVAERVDRPAAKELGQVRGRDKAAALDSRAAMVELDHAEGETLPRQQMIARSVNEAAASPMSGRLMDSRQLLLVRTVVRAQQGYRQGAVIDVEGMSRWLHDSSLGSNELGEQARVRFSTTGFSDDSGKADAAYVYQHRFAEPFDQLSARLSLASLVDGSNLTYIYALSALLLAASTFGLVAIYRMVAVMVAFAERRSNFVAAVSHELKTPLTAIRMYGEMLRDGIVPSEAKRGEYYRHITAESERLSRLIDNVLEFSRLEKGNRSMTLAAGSIVPAVREAAELLRPHVEGNGFRLLVDCDEKTPPVRFERDALVQVLCNLGDNAVKYAADSTPREIELRCRQEDGAVVIRVRDHGPGVPQRHLGKIFEPFYRGENELTRRTKGTGLGLALVHSLCERMGAEVTGSNLEGGGFEVEMRFSV